MNLLTSHLQKLALCLVAVSHFGCVSAVERLGMKIIFEPASIPEERVQRNVSYGETNDDAKQRLDFYLPEGGDWPTMVFVHGGGWTEGDKDLSVGGFSVYGNIGAFYAERGVATAVISYRLQPEVSWRDQVQDVARSVARVEQLVNEHGGSKHAIFLSGHSAGAQLAAFTAVADWPLADSSPKICGVIAISGAGYDLADTETYDFGADPAYYERRFRRDVEDSAWQQAASVTSYLDSDDPPFLVFFGGTEYTSLQHQAGLLDDRLEKAGVDSHLTAIPGLGHRRMVLAFSQIHEMTTETLSFIKKRQAACDS